MPKQDYGIFTPTEAAYTGPKDYERAVLGEATKRGTYLSQMDQFYAELNEMSRQFGEKMDLEERKFESEQEMQDKMLSWYREQEEGRLELSREEIQAKKYLSGRSGKSHAELRREAAGWNVAPEEAEEEEGDIPLSWLSEQIKGMYPGEEETYEAPSRIFFMNPSLGTREEIV